jgi:hypothetical protein
LAYGPGPRAAYNGADLHFSIDLSQARVAGSDRPKPYPVSISSTIITWNEPRSDDAHMDVKFTIDRTTGKIIYEQTFQGSPNGTLTGKCQVATQKF